MKAVIQRVSSAQVTVGSEVVADLPGPGLVVLVGVTHQDTVKHAEALAAKVAHLRIMQGEKSVHETGAGVVVVSQFTLYGQVSRGRRPSWSAAAARPIAEPLVEAVVANLRDLGVWVQTGVFGADMKVSLVNDGPVTLVWETEVAAPA